MIPNERKFNYNIKNPDDQGQYVAYWMQGANRLHFNHALEEAIEQANATKLPLLIITVLDTTYKHIQDREWYWLYGGAKYIAQECAKIKIQHLAFQGATVAKLKKFFTEHPPRLVITDQGYTPWARAWRRDLGQSLNCGLIAVDTNLVIPIRVASNKQEWGAYTLRPKIHKLLPSFLKPLKNSTLINHDTAVPGAQTEIDWQMSLESLVFKNSRPQSKRAGIVHTFEPGEAEAQKVLKDFLTHKARNYSEQRNQVGLDGLSNLSPYLHHGHISPIQIALDMQNSSASAKDKAALIEELIVRRELAHNFIWFNKKFMTFEGLEPWAQKTLNEHRDDERPIKYTLKQLEHAETHDEFWNAAQIEMTRTGKMHGYMRMYWAKKILEWTESPEQALKFAIDLNDTFEIDGGDPNGWTGIAWAIGGKHDRAWAERPIFGMIRYMNAAGLKRKMKHIDDYVSRFTLNQSPNIQTKDKT